jgi:hypothetical protein
VVVTYFNTGPVGKFSIFVFVILVRLLMLSACMYVGYAASNEIKKMDLQHVDLEGKRLSL